MEKKVHNYFEEKFNSDRKCVECREKERFSNADKINLKDYKEDYIYDHLKDEFIAVDVISERYQSEELPKYVYGCERIDLSLDMYSIVETECIDSHFEDAFACIDSRAISELQNMVNKWCKEEGVSSYIVDWDTIVLL